MSVWRGKGFKSWRGGWTQRGVVGSGNDVAWMQSTLYQVEERFEKKGAGTARPLNLLYAIESKIWAK